MVDLRACTRCRGDLHGNQDRYGEYRQCLQCGYVVDIEPPSTSFVHAMGRQKPGRPRKRGRRRKVA